MIASGLRGRVELIRGGLVETMPKSPAHTRAVEALVEFLREKLGALFYIRQEQPLTLVDSEPEPDIVVLKGNRSDYVEHPRTAEWILEVSALDPAYDREKARLYAGAGVAEYWIVMIDAGLVEIYSAPSADGYGNVRRQPLNESITAPVGKLRMDIQSLIR